MENLRKLQGSEEIKLKVRNDLGITERMGKGHFQQWEQDTRGHKGLAALDFSGTLITGHLVGVQHFPSGKCNR